MGKISIKRNIDDWRASNPKREDNLLVSTKSDLSRHNDFSTTFFLRSHNFPLNMFQSFLQEKFCIASKTNFWIEQAVQ